MAYVSYWNAFFYLIYFYVNVGGVGEHDVLGSATGGVFGVRVTVTRVGPPAPSFGFDPT